MKKVWIVILSLACSFVVVKTERIDSGESENIFYGQVAEGDLTDELSDATFEDSGKYQDFEEVETGEDSGV